MEIGPSKPVPSVHWQLPVGRVALRLGPEISDRFSIKADGSSRSATVSGWRDTLKAGFEASFGEPSAALWTVELKTAGLRMRRGRPQPVSKTALASTDWSGALAHGTHGAQPGSSPRRATYARIDVQATLLKEGKRTGDATFTVYSRRSVEELGSATAATKSAVEVMYETLAREFFSE